jgi:hypothetical protein
MPQLSLPIFDGGRNRANLEIAQLRKDMAVASYERSIQTAFREVSDALASVETLRREELARQRLVQTSANTLKLAELRYRAGVDSHLRYLDAQRTDFAQQMALIEVSAQRQMALATLFKALGGGWGERLVECCWACRPATRFTRARQASPAAGSNPALQAREPGRSPGSFCAWAAARQPVGSQDHAVPRTRSVARLDARCPCCAVNSIASRSNAVKRP